MILNEEKSKDMIAVKNIKETSDRVPPDGSDTWEEYWENQSGQKFDVCSACRCKDDIWSKFNAAEVGGHVIKSGSVSKEWYIVPLCKKCNHPSNDGEFNVLKQDLVLANPK